MGSEFLTQRPFQIWTVNVDCESDSGKFPMVRSRKALNKNNSVGISSLDRVGRLVCYQLVC